jgi:hypothetical protein
MKFKVLLCRADQQVPLFEEEGGNSFLLLSSNVSKRLQEESKILNYKIFINTDFKTEFTKDFFDECKR